MVAAWVLTINHSERTHLGNILSGAVSVADNAPSGLHRRVHRVAGRHGVHQPGLGRGGRGQPRRRDRARPSCGHGARRQVVSCASASAVAAAFVQRELCGGARQGWAGATERGDVARPRVDVGAVGRIQASGYHLEKACRDTEHIARTRHGVREPMGVQLCITILSRYWTQLNRYN